MSYVLIIAEKPNAARRIAEALADKRSLKKRSLNGVDYYEFTVNRKKHVCAAAVGHLFVLSPIGSGWTYPIFSYEWVPTYLNRRTSWTKKYFETLHELAKNATEFINAADFDVEGEVLLYNVLRFLCNVENAKRMKFSTLTKDELKEAYKNLLPHLMFPMLEAGLTRHELDWIWGINLTRALTLALRNHARRGFAILSTGRVQGPTLAMLAKREEEIRKFVPKPFWQLQLICKINGKRIVAAYEKDKIWKKELAQKILKSVKGKDAIVKNVRKRKYQQKPPFPFNTTDLQAEAYAQFKFSPQQTLNIAESLYQQGFISYPRSASQKLPPVINYKRILESLAKFAKYRKFVQKLFEKRELKPREGPRKDPAHPAIFATWETPDLKKLTPQQKKLYDLIARRTLAVFGDPAKRESMNVVLDVNGNKFLLVGRRTVEPGWTEIYKPYLKVKEQILPELSIGQKVKVLKCELIQKETQPPTRYSQGSIIKEMEKKMLGTRATRAQILQTLYDRGYINGKAIHVSRLGEIVVKVLKKYCPTILSEKLTRHFEKEMELVYNGKKKREDVIKEARKVLEKVLKKIKRKEKEIGKELLKALIEARRAERRIGVCPNCGGELRIIVSRSSGKRFVGCGNFPKCKTAFPIPLTGKIVSLNKLCEHCNLPMIQVWRKGKRPFRMCINPKCKSKKNWGKK
jgi:DNA topoisomerase-1